MHSIPEDLRTAARAAGAEHWLGGLPGLVADLEARWMVTVGRSLAGATEAYVTEATTAEGLPVVLKILLPWTEDRARNEITVLRVAGGRGCAALLRDDPAAGALLLERLGPSLFELDLPISQRHAILCDTVAKVWRPAAGYELPTGAERGRQLATYITDSWEQLDRPCSEQAIDHAVACAERRATAHDDERAVLVHGDVHQLNALQAGEEFKLIDPKGILAEAEYDLGTIMRGDPVELLDDADPHDRAHQLAAHTGMNPTAIWEWGIIERVTTALHCLRIDVQPLGRQTLAAVEAIAWLET